MSNELRVTMHDGSQKLVDLSQHTLAQKYPAEWMKKT